MDARLQGVVLHAAEGGDDAGMARRHGRIAGHCDDGDAQNGQKLLGIEAPGLLALAGKAQGDEQNEGQNNSD